MKKAWTFLSMGLILWLLAACGQIQDLGQERADLAREAHGDIVIGVVEWSDGLAWKAIQMAAEEINAAGGINTRKIRLVHEDDNLSILQGKSIAQRFAAELDMVAVIGHGSSTVSLPASATYQFSGMVMLSHAATAPRLTEQGFGLVFRNIPSDAEIGRLMATYVHQQDYQRVMVLSEKSTYGHGLGNAFEMYATRLGVRVVDRVSYRSGENDFSTLLANWGEVPFDAIFIAGNSPEAADFIVQARQAGFNQPILGGDGLLMEDLPQITAAAGEGLIVATYFHPDDPRPEVQRFVSAFYAKYGTNPDVWAAQGYDAVKLLTHAILMAGSTEPQKIAQALRETKDWPGVTGPHTFNEHGDVVGKPIILTILHNGAFEFYRDFNQPATP